MPTLSPKNACTPVDAGTELATTSGFTSSHDIAVDHDCWVVLVEIVVPSGETVAISKVTAAGNVLQLLPAATTGAYFLGEPIPMIVGEKLRAVSSGVVSGDREFRAKATRRTC